MGLVSNKHTTNTSAIRIDQLESDKGAIVFYEKLGFKFLEVRTMGKSVCSVYKLDREDWLHLLVI